VDDHATAPPLVAGALAETALAETALAASGAGSACAPPTVEAAVRAERDRIADLLHDVVARHVVDIWLHATLLGSGADASAGARSRDAIEQASARALTGIRRAVRLLRADDADDLAEPARGVVAAAAVVADDLAALNIPVAVEAEPGASSGRADELLALVVAEAGANIARHASGSDDVVIRLVREAGRLRLRVENSCPVGAGSSTAVPGGSGSGLPRLAERLRAAGGSLVASRRDDRWSLVAEVPIGSADSDVRLAGPSPIG
jgi:two-component system, NarL family, sensor histidine kinase DesK